MNEFDDWYIEYDDEVGLIWLMHKKCQDGMSVDNYTVMEIIGAIHHHDCVED